MHNLVSFQLETCPPADALPSLPKTTRARVHRAPLVLGRIYHNKYVEKMPCWRYVYGTNTVKS